MKNSNYLFEISWEVCNKVGGIYTVITSKENVINSKFDNYFQVGPYIENSKNYFVDKPITPQLRKAKAILENQGIKIHYGTSKYNENVDVILVEYIDYANHINDIKTELWNQYQIDSLNSEWYDYDETMLWSWCTGIAIEEISKQISKPAEKILIHAHEWMSGGSIFYTNLYSGKKFPGKFKTIFTTHASILGRSLSENSINLKDELTTLDPDEFSYKMGVSTKHQTEKALANNSDCFTTVSNITNDEVSFFYSKSADIILYNGFDNQKIKNLDLLNSKYYSSRKQTNKLLENIFSKLPEFNIDKTKLFYTSGRNEYKNKGFDIYIKSLAKLNDQLIKENSEIKLVNFFLVPIGEFEKINLDKANEIPLTTHIICEHPILKELKNCGLQNSPGDKVFNILVPKYLNGEDGVVNRKYYDFISGFDLGVFPSYYEPWGYTPLESISYAVPTITSDLAGFGRHIQNHYGDFNPSVQVLKRTKLNETRSIEKLYEMLYDQVTRNQKSQILQREFAKLTSLKYDWEIFVSNYIKAYNLALGENKKFISELIKK
jgi:phosphorylase/glycogen(starch) synthase